MIRAASVCALALLGGCNALFGLDDTMVVDAATQIDSTLVINPVCDPPYVVDGDFDGDGVPNAADPCPAVPAPAGSVDTDLDGVGDDCDPAPAVPGDCIVMFEDFRAPRPECWALAGAWAPGCDPAAPDELCSPSDLDDARLVYARLLSMSSIRLEASVVDLNGATPSQTPNLELFERYEDDASTELRAEGIGLGRVGAEFEVSAVSHDVNGGIQIVSMAGQPVLAFGAARVAMGWDPETGGSRIWFKAASDNGITSSGFTRPGLGAGGRPALRVSAVQVRLRSLVGYGHGSQCISQ